MAQPNVAREPSMDEILASIRRIIESNEPVIQAGMATVDEPSGFSGRPANDDSEEVSLTVDDRFADDRQAFAPVEVAVEASAPAPQKSLSLADVAARVRAASERGAAREPAPSQAVTEVHMQRPSVEAVPAQIAADPAREMAFEPEHDPRLAPADIADEEAAVHGEAPSLLSSMAGEQVARSFQDLAFAVESAERRSFDDIAEEMLRPMLQEWLDDNLPTLVERLVREEIERVVRGPRR